MTYSAMLKLSSEELLIATDRSATNQVRSYTNVKKIFDKGRYVVANAGKTNTGEEIVLKWLSLPLKESFREELEQFKGSFQAVFDDSIKYIPKEYAGVSFEDYSKGNISKKLTEMIASEIKNFSQNFKEGFSSNALFGGFDNDTNNMEIHYVYSPGASKRIADRFDITGIGIDLGEDPLYHSTNRFSPEEVIPKHLALHLVSTSLVHSSRNVVVAGIPEIAFADKKHVEKLNDKVSAVSFNLARKELDGKINSEDVMKQFERLLDKNTDVEQVAKQYNIPTDYIISR